MLARTVASSIATAILALGIVAGGSSATRVRDLQAWATARRHPPVGVTTSGYIHPHVVKNLPPGTYRVSIIATEALGFQLIGPGINRHTPVLLTDVPPHDYATNTTWRIRLRRGTYGYRAIGPYANTVKPATGFFQVR